MKKFNVAVVGATGIVGESMISILEERAFPVEQLTPIASKRSLGQKVSFRSEDLEIINLDNFDFRGIDFAFFSAGASVSREFAPIAAKAGAEYVSPFIGRLDDLNLDGIDLISDIKLIYSNYKFSTKILAASIRTINHVKQCACFGADVATIPLDIFEKLVKHPLTDSGLSQFTADWEKTGQSII